MTTTRIWLAAQSFLPVRGGGTIRLYRYFPGLRARGAHVSVLTGTHKAAKIVQSDHDTEWYKLPPGARIPNSELANGTPMWGVRLPDEHGSTRHEMYLEWLFHELDRASEKPDVLAIGVQLNSATEHWLRRIAGLGVPTAYLFTLTNKQSSNPLRAWRKRRSLRRQYDGFDCIIVASADHEAWLRELGVKTRIEVVPNGVDAQRFCPPQDSEERNTLREKLGFTPDQKIVLNVGAVTPRKGTDLAIEAVAALALKDPEYQLIVVGPRTDQQDPELATFAKKIDELISKPETRDRIHLRGMVDEVEVYYRIADALVFPTEREGMPNALLEAMASGVPAVLTSFVGLTEDFGKPGIHYLLSDREPGALASTLEKILDESVGDPIAERARDLVVERMALSKSLDRYAETFHELSDSKTPGASPTR